MPSEMAGIGCRYCAYSFDEALIGVGKIRAEAAHAEAAKEQEVRAEIMAAHTRMGF